MRKSKTPHQIGVHVRSIRRAIGLTQGEAATCAGVHVNTWRRVEQGRGHVELETMRRVAAALRYPLPTLTDGR